MKYAFSAIFTKENQGYSVLCPELGVASQGTDLKEAEYNIREAVELFIKDIPENELVSYEQAHKDAPLVKVLEVSHA